MPEEGDSRRLKLIDATEGIDHAYREAADLLREVGLTDAAVTLDTVRSRTRRAMMGLLDVLD